MGGQVSHGLPICEAGACVLCDFVRARGQQDKNDPVQVMADMRRRGFSEEDAIQVGGEMVAEQAGKPIVMRAELSIERGVLPSRLPEGWKARGQCQVTGCHRYRHRDGLTVAVTTSEESDGDAWLHASFSRRHRVPDWNDVTRVKHVFIGDHRKAVSILPATTEHVNLHPRCLHLWSNLDRDPLPDLRNAGQI